MPDFPHVGGVPVDGTILVIGAGIAGLLVASDLARYGRRVIVLEKSKGFGGRLATKRVGRAVCDSGAQFFTVRDLRFAGRVSEWEDRGWVRPWPGMDSGDARWMALPSMNGLGRALADGLDVRLETRVVSLSREGPCWRVGLSTGASLYARQVLATAPAPQVLEWLALGDEPLDGPGFDALRRIDYDPCLALVAELDRDPPLGPTGALKPTVGPLGWLADNRHKGVSPVPALTLHATPEWSAEHFERDTQEIGRLLLEAAKPWLGEARVLEQEVHRWRYSRVRVPAPMPHWRHPDGGLVLAGDGFGGARVEGAVLSAFSALRSLLCDADR